MSLSEPVIDKHKPSIICNWPDKSKTVFRTLSHDSSGSSFTRPGVMEGVLGRCMSSLQVTFQRSHNNGWCFPFLAKTYWPTGSPIGQGNNDDERPHKSVLSVLLPTNR